jgi:hypothetical protein
MSVLARQGVCLSISLHDLLSLLRPTVAGMAVFRALFPNTHVNGIAHQRPRKGGSAVP